MDYRRHCTLTLKSCFLLISVVSILSLIHLALMKHEEMEWYWIKHSFSKQRVNGVVQGQGDDEKRYVVGTLVSGLGNHLWIYASLYGIAKKTRRVPIVCAKYNLSTLFSNLSLPLWSFNNCKSNLKLSRNSTLNIKEKQFIHYDTAMVARLRESNYKYAFISTFLQNIGYFLEYVNELKPQFKIREPFRLVAQHFLHRVLKAYAKRNFTINMKGKIFIGKGTPVFVAIHVRRGDMLKHAYTRVPGRPYFDRAMKYFRNKYGGHVIFIIVTNGYKWSQMNIKGNDVFITRSSGPKSKEEDFAIAVACNHTVISVGTFGWWVGFLAGGEVVYFKDWVKGRAKPWYNMDQYFPHNFKAMV